MAQFTLFIDAMKNFVRICVVILAIPVLYLVMMFGLIRWEIYNSSTFNKKVASLPPQELKNFALRCDALLTEFHAKNTNSDVIITDKEILDQFILLDKKPKSVYVFNSLSFVVVQYLYSGRFGATIQWRDYSMWDEPVWRLEARSGDTGGFTLYELPKKPAQVITNSP